MTKHLYVTEDMTAEEALRFTLAFLDSSPDDEAICSAALSIGEPLIDWHWRTIGDEFLRLATTRSAVRKMISCCWFDSSVQEDLQDRLSALVGPDDDVGSRPVTRSQPRLKKGLDRAAPELAARLAAATPEQVALVLVLACRVAVEDVGYSSDDVFDALDWIAGERVLSDTQPLIDRLWQEAQRLRDQVRPSRAAR